MGLAVFCWLAASVGGAGPAFAGGAPEMAVPGQANVSASGAFTYTIPIAVPPGTKGMAPSLSLSYSSQSGDGFVGLGWSLGGLSMIERCPRTLAQDTVHGSVNYDMNDRFCLDGQRLILISGTYGADGSIYRTEIDHFSKVIAHGTAGNGPSWFEVHPRTGQTLQYGDTTDSQVLAQGITTARAWALNKVTDPKGNYLTVTYNSASGTDRTANGEVYPTRIDYTGNAGASLSTYNSVQFSYTTRSDVVPYYQAGSLQQTTVLLTDVKTYNGASVVLDYKLAYTAASSNASHDELASVTQCDASSNCLAPTTFGWQGSRDNPTASTVAQSGNIASGTSVAQGDFNGDGLTDLLVETTTCFSGGDIFYANASGGFVSANMTASYSTFNGNNTPIPYSGAACFPNPNSVPADFNADGITDLEIDVPYWVKHYNIQLDQVIWVQVAGAEILSNNGNGQLTQISGNGSQTFPFASLQWGGTPNDFNADGRADGFLVTGALTTFYELGNGDGTFTQTSGPSDSSGAGWSFADFDGDGCSDLMLGATIYYQCQPATPTTVTNFSGTEVFGDFNGDGKTDVLVLTSTGAQLYLSTGTGFASPYTIPNSSSWVNSTVVVGDWNGDGKTDIAVISSSQTTVYLSTGTGFMQRSTVNAAGSPVVADWNNDGAMDMWLQGSGTANEILFSYVPELMTSVSNGVGATTTATYDRLNKNGSLYAKCANGTYVCGDTYPTQAVDGAFYVVSGLSTSNGIGGNYAWTYAYGGLKKDLYGRGMLGFAKITVTDSQTGLVTTTNYQTAFPYSGLVASQTVVSGTTTLKSVTNTWTSTNEGTSSPGAAYYFVSLQQSVVASNDLNGAAFPGATTSYTYDSYGNALTKTVSVTDGSSQTTTNTFANDTTNWFLGQLLTTQTQSIVGSSNLTRHYSFAYDTQNALDQAVVEPGTSSLSVTAGLTLDTYGNTTSTSLSGTGITTRSFGTTMDSYGRFAIATANALSQSTSLAFSASFGELTSSTDPNSLTSSASYDTLGRLTLATRPDGNKTSVSYLYCSGVNGGTASCPTTGAYLMQSTPQTSGGAQNGPETIAYYDALGRVIAGDVQGFDGSWIRTATQYDANGRVSQTSRPYFVSGGTAKWTVYSYDTLSRVTQATFPDASKTIYGFNGLTTTVTNDKSQVTTTVKNAQGLVASVTDAASKTTSYVYDAFGDVTSVTDPSGNAITNTFDLRGRKTASSDPDMGSWSYVYDVLSELTSQTDAKSQTTSIAYDLLSRPTQRSEADLISNWVYDTATHGVGALTSACTGSGCTSSSSTTFKASTYDSLGRPSTYGITVGGSTYTYTTSYDSNGRIATVTYPSGFVAQYVYTSLGYLSQIRDSASGTVYWQANTRDAELHLLTQTAGNGVNTTQSFDANTGRLLAVCATPDAGACDGDTANFSYSWDTIGNLTSRADTYQGYTENFCYDALNRLTNYALGSGVSSCTASGTGIVTKTVAFDPLGNITSKSDVGTYSYPSAGSAHPHAVSSITGTVNGVVNPTFTYDADGTMTAGDGRSVTPTSFNMAAAIVQGSTSLCLVYDSDHARITQVQTTATCASPGSGASTTTYLNGAGAMEELYTGGATSTWRDYIVADSGIVALRSTTSGTVTMAYFNGDHLGSTSVLTNASGAVTERDSYDAWGRRRNANGTDSTSCSITSATTRGYTGQEMLDPVCAINLNARLYDPTIGRIMSADPTVPDAFNGQSFNRYSYVENGPLSAIDPTGFKPTNGTCNTDSSGVPHCTYDATSGNYSPPIPDGCGGPCPIYDDCFYAGNCGDGVPSPHEGGLTSPGGSDGGGGDGSGGTDSNAPLGSKQNPEVALATAPRLPPPRPPSLPVGSLVMAGFSFGPEPKGSDENRKRQCSINKNLQGWGNWFLNKGAVMTRAGSTVTILGASIDAIPTPPTWISGTTGVAIGGGMVAVGTVMQAGGVAFLYSAGDNYGAVQGGIGALLAAPQNDISAVAPSDPTDATAAALTNTVLGPNPCR